MKDKKKPVGRTKAKRKRSPGGGRKKSTDKKIRVELWIPQSELDAWGGKEPSKTELYRLWEENFL